jgi:23S rRNA (uracil1939-C5)-methyltransferase
MKKNEVYVMSIEDVGTEGEGIGHIVEDDKDGRGIAVFVKDTVVGDVIRVRILKVKKSYAYGRLEQLIEPSPYRVKPRCAKARSCGGCTLMHMDYKKQLDYKWNKVKNCLERIGNLQSVEERMEPICGMTEPYYFRNKMQFPVGINKEGKVQIGFFAGHTHTIVDLERCEIGHPVNNYILTAIRPWLQKWQDRTGTFIYREEEHKGLIRHVLTRVGFSTGEVMVCLVVNGIGLPSPIHGAANNTKGNTKYNTQNDIERRVLNNMKHALEQDTCEVELLESLNQAIERYNSENTENISAGKLKCKLTTLVLNVNQEKTNRILGDSCRILYGDGYITDNIGDIRFQISPMSFYQVNPVQTKVLYDKAVEYAGLTGEEIVWDMYCGIGTISLCLAKKAKKVYGVEIVPQAIEDAKRNAALNGLTNTEFFCGKAEEVVLKSRPDVVVVDPPRKGCDEALLDTIATMAPTKVVYVSCDPATLARDVKRLGELGYHVERIVVVDQFCHSGHVETVCLLSRKAQ